VQKRALIYDKYKGRATVKTKVTQVNSVNRESLEAVTRQIVTKIVDGEKTTHPHRAAAPAQLLLDYQDEHKVLSTYLISVMYRLDKNGRVHPDFLLHGTETSRLSCREPNIQNIPRESEMRGIYVAPPGYVMVIGDYDQIELRKMAVEADDPTLCGLFNSGQDVHRGTAALVLAKEFEDTDDEERQNFGKMPNFLMGYGGQAPNLADKTGITVDRAQRVIDAWYKRFNRIQPWKDKVVRDARMCAQFASINGERTMIKPPFVETMLGRRRRLPELMSNDRKTRMRAERQAVNTVIQGSASETALLAMVDITAYSRKENFPMDLCINVHDEIVGMVPEHLADEGKEMMAELMREVRVPHTMERPLKGKVPLAVKVVVGEKWLK
jgi:DNA polymerase-1